MANNGRIPFVQQTEQADCGPACLAMVLAYYGKWVPLEELRQAMGGNLMGVDAATLLRTARWYGLDGQGLRMDIDDLRSLEPGAVLHWKFYHFVVFERCTRNGAIVVDPAAGRVTVSNDELNQSFTGVALRFRPNASFRPSAQPKGSRRRVLGLVLSQPRMLWQVIVASLLLQVVRLAFPVLTGLLVDQILPTGSYRLLHVLGAGLAVTIAFQAFTSVVRGYLLVFLRSHVDHNMTRTFMEHLLRLPYSFFQARSAGDLQLRVNSNSIIREGLTSSVLTTLLDGVLVSLYVVIILATEPSMGLLCLLLGALQVSVLVLTRHQHREAAAKEVQAQSRSQSYLIQLLEGIEVIKSSGAEERVLASWLPLFTTELNATTARGRLTMLTSSVMDTFRVASPLLLLYLGGLQVLNGHLSLGVMLSLQSMATSFLTPLSSLVSTALQLHTIWTYVDRMNDVLDAPVEQEPRAKIQAPRLTGAVQLHNVSFRYSPLGPEVIRDVSVSIWPGMFLAIVGPSGSGKSTLARLLVGLYRPTSGTITFDGMDLAQLEYASVRRQIGVVTQTPYLFGSSVLDNITLQDPEISLARVVEVAKLAQIHDDILALPMGYETPVSGAGGLLSGGQRQRIALARALVHDPVILLLDEATSALDTVTERRVQEAIDSLRCTRIVIAQRLSTIRHADMILVVDNGTVVERGTHDELMAAGGKYAEMVAAQQV